jgi:hypothetical protein
VGGVSGPGIPQTDSDMKDRAYEWADDALVRFGPETPGAWRHLVWRMMRPAAREFVAAGFVGGYGAAQNDAEREGSQ